jgi:hypothetical protein
MVLIVSVDVITVGLINHLHAQNRGDPYSSLAAHLSQLGGAAMIATFILAAVGASKDEPEWAVGSACLLSAASFFVYIQ